MANTIAIAFEQIKQQTITQKGFHECSEALYFEALGAVPPIYLPNGTGGALAKKSNYSTKVK